MFNGIIRELRREDLESIKAIFSLHWADEGFGDYLIKRLEQSFDNVSESPDKKLSYYVAEDSGEVIGVMSYRKAPEHMRVHTKTANPVELYVIAAKVLSKGVGRALVERLVELVKSGGYTEIVLYSSEVHKKSWGFYDHLNFEIVGPATAPNGEPGQIWRMVFE